MSVEGGGSERGSQGRERECQEILSAGVDGVSGEQE